MSDGFVTLLRHGEVAGGERFRGPSDDPLSKRGREQLEAACAGPRGWTRLIASPSRRCRDPASALAERLGIPMRIDPGLTERGFGDWNSRRATEVPESDLMEFYADPTAFTPPRAEPLESFALRVGRSWTRLLWDAQGETLVVTHGGVIRVIIAGVLQMPLKTLGLIEVPYACRTRIRVPEAPGQPSLISHGTD
jgi:broad specificity phosphatase PhoE